MARGQASGDERDAHGAALIRRTTIELGWLRITREYRVAALHPDYPFANAVVPARVRLGGWRNAGLIGMVVAASAGGLAVASTHVAPSPVYAISRAVPERPAPLARPVSTKRVIQPRVDTPASPVVADRAALPDTTDTGSRAIAIAAALRSGEVQEWYEVNGGIHGFVVAGAEERDGGRTCRALSVLTRAPGGADRVDQHRECLPAAAS